MSELKNHNFHNGFVVDTSMLLLSTAISYGNYIVRVPLENAMFTCLRIDVSKTSLKC